MFIGLSKTFAKFGKFRIGAGLRITKSNAWFMWFILLMYYMILMCWYCMVLCFWMIYAIGYGIFALIRWVVRKFKK